MRNTETHFKGNHEAVLRAYSISEWAWSTMKQYDHPVHSAALATINKKPYDTMWWCENQLPMTRSACLFATRGKVRIFIETSEPNAINCTRSRSHTMLLYGLVVFILHMYIYEEWRLLSILLGLSFVQTASEVQHNKLYTCNTITGYIVVNSQAIRWRFVAVWVIRTFARREQCMWESCCHRCLVIPDQRGQTKPKCGPNQKAT